MKDRPDAIIHTQQAAYLQRLLPKREALLEEIERMAVADGIPICDPELGIFLQQLVRAMGARRVLEVGGAIAYGTLCMATGSEGVEVTVIERDLQRAEIGRGFCDRAEVGERVHWLVAEARDVLPTLEPPFDLVFLDGDKDSYRKCLDLGLQLLRVGGVVVVDNLLWKGQVADPPEDLNREDDEAEILRTFNNYFSIHPQLQTLILPFGDGVGLGVKKRPLVTDLGGPF